LNISSKILEPVIVSKWADKSPAVSPSGHTLAFVSYRSGEDEIWTYNLTSFKYKQITGESFDNFRSPYSEIQWLDDERVLTSVSRDNQIHLVTLHVTQ
jgi:Tol biopolymer transport system component